MLAIAQTVCATFTHTSTEIIRGESVTWAHSPTAILTSGINHEDTLIIQVDVNRVISKTEAITMVNEATKAVAMAWDAAGLLPNGRYHAIKFGAQKRLVLSLGYWHMGIFSVTGVRRSVRVPG